MTVKDGSALTADAGVALEGRAINGREYRDPLNGFALYQKGSAQADPFY